MISLNELRIGNWVYVGEGQNPWVMKLDGNSMEVYIGDGDDHGLYPIPISEDILKKAGFEQIKDSYVGHLKIVVGGVNFIYGMRGINIEIDSEWKNIEHIEYIHQLQNLVHALTGEELNVEL